ncbi:uncharacterized protein [Periplaneta americana]|uniref:uncharacterized protein n=1 Tax=Periplaneta americana TaxID=6978 RepID=UPI0037E7F651
MDANSSTKETKSMESEEKRSSVVHFARTDSMEDIAIEPEGNNDSRQEAKQKENPTEHHYVNEFLIQESDAEKGGDVENSDKDDDEDDTPYWKTRNFLKLLCLLTVVFGIAILFPYFSISYYYSRIEKRKQEGLH